MPIPVSIPVVIVGGGEVGLSASIQLSLHGIPHVLLERHPTTTPNPRAGGRNQRTMEIFRQLGIEEEVMRRGSPQSLIQKSAWYTSFGPEGKKLAERDGFGYGLSQTETGDAFRKASPCAWTTLGQKWVEPILKDRAELLNPGGIYFNHEVDSVQETETGVKVTYHARSGDDQVKLCIQAKYVIGADGGRFLTEHLGIGWDGVSDLVDMVTVFFQAPLSSHGAPPNACMTWFVNPDLGGSVRSGAIYPCGPYPVHPDTESWAMMFAVLPGEKKASTDQEAIERLHRTLKVPELEGKIKVLTIGHWSINGKWAKSFSSPQERVFLVGDAAHRVCPWGALGANTGYQDVENLIWKLSLALKLEDQHDVSPLLRTYDAERRPVGRRVAEKGVRCMKSHNGILDQALGVSLDNTPAINASAIRDYLEGTNVASQNKREAVAEALKTLDLEFGAIGAEVGYCYDHSAIYDGEEWQSPQFDEADEFKVLEYHPCTVPGHQLPHAWLEDSAGRRVSTRWLVEHDKFLLLTRSKAWAAPVQHDGRLSVFVIDECVWRDATGLWAEQREIQDSGAVLVRPDNIVAWRWLDGRISAQGESAVIAEINRVLMRVLSLEQ